MESLAALVPLANLEELGDLDPKDHRDKEEPL